MNLLNTISMSRDEIDRLLESALRFKHGGDLSRPLAGKSVDRITIRFAEIGPTTGWRQEGMYAPTRWLLEIYPIDEILAQEL